MFKSSIRKKKKMKNLTIVIHRKSIFLILDLNIHVPKPKVISILVPGWAWRPSLSYSQDHLYKFSFPTPRSLNIQLKF